MFKEKLKNFFEIIKPSLIAVGIGLFIGFIVMLIFNPSGAFPGLLTMFSGGLGIGMKGLGDILLKASVLILTGLALVVSFKTGLFNIGAPGQMAIGGYVAIHIGVLWKIPSPFHWMVALILGTIAGAIWGMIPGMLKAFTNTNEVVSSIMSNYIGMHLTIYLIGKNVKNPLYGKTLNIKSSAELPRFGNLFQGSKVNIGILIAIIVGILIYYLFKKTKLGYELKASGFNQDASKYAGMNSKKNIVIAMLISGALAGLAGAVNFLVIGTNMGTTTDLLSEGFDGITVALLGLLEPIGAIISGFFLSFIRQGGFYMQGDGFATQIIDIITSIIVYTTSIAAGIQLYIKHLKQKRLRKKESLEVIVETLEEEMEELEND